MTREEKIQKHQYKKMVRNYKRQLNHIAKQAEPWDSGELLHLIETYLKFMKDYYTLNYNVYGIDDISATTVGSQKNSRLKSLTETLSEFQKYLNAYEPFDEDKSKLSSEEKHKLLMNCEKEEKSHWNKFWKLFSNNVRNWWD